MLRRMNKIALLFVALLAGPASAQQASQEAELLRCAGIPVRDERLACFDALAAGLATARKSGAAPAAPVQAKVQAQEFGLEAQPRRDQLEAIESHIEGLFEGWEAGTVIRLANGQAWRVIDGSSAVLYLKSPKVRVRRAALGSFMLELEGSNSTARVRRLP